MNYRVSRFTYDSATLDCAAREALETSAACLERNPVYRPLLGALRN